MNTTMTITEMNGCDPCNGTELVSRERTAYFPGQLVGPDDLTQDQVYFREKMRRHNRLLHGWGVVCGALVAEGDGCTVRVSPGYILGPFGDEIVISDEVGFDICKQRTEDGLDCADVDPWCADSPRIRDDEPVYLAVRYAERRTRPVRVPSCGCGCDEGACEYSRIRDGFELAVLTELPSTYRKRKGSSPREVFSCERRHLRRCPECPEEPWVVLADVTVAQGKVVEVDCAAHRRYVVSFAEHWYACRGKKPRDEDDGRDPDE